MRNIGNDHKVLLKEEVILLLHTARNDMEEAMIALAVGAGARSSEMAKLRVADFIPYRNEIKLYNI